MLKIRQRKIINLFCLIGLCSAIFSGCETKKTIQVDTSQIEIKEETSTRGIDLTKKGATLTSGEYYVLHNGIYYPAYYYLLNYEDQDIPEKVNTNRQIYFPLSTEYDIPTLYLENDDKLIYYDELNVLDYIVWERYEDLGYTFGLYGLQTTTSGRYYIDVEDGASIITDTGLEKILDDITETDVILIDKIGNTQVTSNIVENGLITGATRGQTYSLDIYNGTQYHHYSANANVHAFRAFELFASIEYKTLRAYTYELEIPDYLVDGYYKLSSKGVNGTYNTGLIRILKKGNSFNLLDINKFNTPLLYIYTPEDLLNIANGKTVDKQKSIYSTYEPLNKYTTEVIGSLGYKTGEKDEVTEKVKKNTLAIATTRQFNINFPKDKKCLIELKPEQIEPSGDIYIYIGKEKYSFNYDSISNTYTYEYKGDDNTYTLFISGIWGSYDIKLTSCKQDNINTSKSEVINQSIIDKDFETKKNELKESTNITSEDIIKETTKNNENSINKILEQMNN